MTVISGALETGAVYALAALGLYLSYRVLKIADMTTDGAFTLGCAVSARLAVAGHPWLALAGAMLAGAGAGGITALLQTRLKIPPILAGIITTTGLYTVNLAVMGFSSNVSMLRTETVFTLLSPALGQWCAPFITLLIALTAAGGLGLFLGTRLGLSIRATGDNPHMVRASSINTAFTITVGLCLANALTALSGGVLAQYQRTADINIGSGLVISGLASLMIGEALPGGKGRVLGAVAGSILYRGIVALALRLDLSSEYLKLVSAVIVALAIGVPAGGRRRGGRKHAAAG